MNLLEETKGASFVPAGLWRWKAILETEDKHYVIRLHSQNLNCEESPKTDLSALPPHMLVKEVDIYNKYARYLSVQVQYDRLSMSNLIYSLKVFPFTGCFADPKKPLIKIGKPKCLQWLRVLCERHY